MKLKFGSKDSVYKIFSSLEKLIPGKMVYIFIDEDNPIFDNIWRWLQIKELLGSKNIKYAFVPLNKAQQRYYQEAGLNIQDQTSTPSWRQKLVDILFVVGSRQKELILSRSSKGAYFILFIELLAIFLGVWYIWNILNTSAVVLVKPAYEVKHYVYPFVYYDNTLNIDKLIPAEEKIYVPYYTWSFEYEQALSIPTQDIKYLSKQAEGVLKIYNYTPKSYPLRATTRFVTRDGLVFRSKHWVNVPSGTPANPGIAYVEVRADEVDEQGNVIWARWNISTGEVLYIKNLWQSLFEKKIVAYPTKPFQWWETQKVGTVTTWDIANLKKLIESRFQKNLKKIIKAHLRANTDQISLPVSLADYKIKRWDIQTPLNSNQGEVKWVGVFEVSYKYINSDDFRAAVDKYLMQRPSEVFKVVRISTSDVQFLDIQDWSEDFNLPPYKVLRIFTDFKIIAGYDFKRDTNFIKEAIKEKIKGKTAKEAVDIIRKDFWDQIDSVWIKISPPWYDQLPQLKSRIYFKEQK